MPEEAAKSLRRMRGGLMVNFQNRFLVQNNNDGERKECKGVQSDRLSTPENIGSTRAKEWTFWTSVALQVIFMIAHLCSRAMVGIAALTRESTRSNMTIH